MPNKTERKELAEEFTKKMDSLRKKRLAKRKRDKATPTKDQPDSKQKTLAKRKRDNATPTKDQPDSKKKTVNEDEDTQPAKDTERKSPKWKDRKINYSSNFKKGSTISGQWKGPEFKGDWYEGTIVSIDAKNQTVHVRYNDGDSDRKLKWSNMRVIKY